MTIHGRSHPDSIHPGPLHSLAMRLAPLALAALALLSGPTFAADPPPAATTKKPEKPVKEKPKKKISISLPSFGEVPKAEGVQRSRNDVASPGSRTAATDATYQVVSVAHGKAFKGGPNGAVPIAALEAVKIKEDKLTEKFSTVIRVRSPQRQSAEIEVAILDPRGTTALSASGTLSYRGSKSDESEWLVDWDPSPVIGPGAYQVLVRVAGQPMGTWPLKLTAE